MSWSRAFARQACSDFDARDLLLSDPSLPHCHQLHYLQMAMEKAAKAHLINAGQDPLSVQSSHGYIAKVIPIIVMNGLGRSGGDKSSWVMHAIRQLAEKINRLHPQIDHQSVPANCEYPWQAANGEIIAPADHDFGLNLLKERTAITMVKVVRTQVIELAQ